MRKRTFLLLAVAAILAALIVVQIHQWRKFDWAVFREQTEDVNWWLVAGAVVLIHAADALRGLRWAIFLRPVKRVNSLSLVAPQFVGFSALALLGRPGELIRPYIIARRTGLTMSSQMAVWAVERLFDISAVACLFGTSMLVSGTVRALPYYSALRNAGLVIIGVVILGAAGALLIRKYGARLSIWVEQKYGQRYPASTARIRKRMSAFVDGLHTIHDWKSFIQIALLSLVIWGLVASSYRLVTNAYQQPLSDFGFAEVMLLMFASIAGGVLQLPAVGGGSQLATIAVLMKVFGVVPELSTSCGILLWLVTFMSVVPLGVVLAQREHVSFRQLVKEEEQAEARTIG
jgi:uncharacterized protein (TIRG00374 family)